MMADRNNPDDELELMISDSQPSQKKSSSSDKNVQSSCICCTKRCIVAMLVCFGFVITFGMRSNSAILDHSDWTTKQRLLIFSTYFWSYLLALFPGGILASIYPANRIFGISVICSSVLNLLLPVFVTLHHIPVIVIMLLQGMFEGVLIPACYGMLRFWTPPSENSRFVTFSVFGGEFAGVLLAGTVYNILTRYHHWSITFYVYSVLGIIWFVLWQWLVFEKPASHPTISLEEKTYIEQSLDGTETKVTFKTIPWRNIFTSMPVYAIIVANLCRSWTFYTLSYFQILYLLNVFNIELRYGSRVIIITFIVLVLVVPIGGVIADCIRNKNILSTTNVRKVFTCGGLAIEGILFLMLAYFVKSATEAMIILIVGGAFGGLALIGFDVNYMDIAPRYASTLIGLSQGIIGMTAGDLSPTVFQAVFKNGYEDTAKWTYMFLSGACVHLIGVIFYAIFASGELQPWAEPKSSTSEDPEIPADDKTQLTSTEPINYGTK